MDTGMIAQEKPRDAGRDALAGRVRIAREGDSPERERLIEEYRPFVGGIVRRMMGSRILVQNGDRVEQFDEFSIGLAAFNEAIDHYVPDTGTPFLSYAGLVINRRLVDWFRHETRDRSAYRFSDLEEEGETPLAERLSAPEADLLSEMEAEEEILALQQRLSALGLSLFRIQRGFPKHQDSRRMCVRLARLLQQDSGWMAGLEQTRRIPCAELARRSGTPVKTIEKNRSNIVLIALMMDSGLDVIKGYLKNFEEERK